MLWDADANSAAGAAGGKLDIDGHKNSMWLAASSIVYHGNGAVHYAAYGGFTPKDNWWRKHGSNYVAHGLA